MFLNGCLIPELCARLTVALLQYDVALLRYTSSSSIYLVLVLVPGIRIIEAMSNQTVGPSGVPIF